MRLKDKKFALDGIVHMSEMLPTIGIMDSDAADAFTAEVNVSFGDASYTLVNIREFYLNAIKHSFQISLAWVEFEKQMLDNGVKYINLEG